tara:strand:- start:38 stop:385 length:348 start_codon:yes stop_codon:yes gene_type:complete
MTKRTLTYKKNGYDIIGYFSGVGEDRKAEIWSKPYGETDHVYCGMIYKGLTSSHGTERGCGSTWTTKNDGTGEDYALRWFEAARKLKRKRTWKSGDPTLVDRARKTLLKMHGSVK